MKRIMLIAGLATLFAAGTAAAQTSVEMSFGFGVPRPYISGDVFIGRSFVRPVYRPFYYYYPSHYPYYFYEPLPLRFGSPHRVIIYERDHRFYRRDFDREREWERNHARGRDWDRGRGHDRERNRQFDQDRRYHDNER